MEYWCVIVIKNRSPRFYRKCLLNLLIHLERVVVLTCVPNICVVCDLCTATVFETYGRYRLWQDSGTCSTDKIIEFAE